MKQNSRAIVGEVAKPSGVSFDELDCAIESFSASVVDSVFTVVKQARQMSPEHLDYLLDGFQATSHGVVGPGGKETLSGSRVVIAPELSERFFDAPCSAGLEVELIQGAKRNRFGTPPIGIVLEPRPFATSQRRATGLSQAAVFLFAHRIDRFTEVLGNMKPVMDDVGLGEARFYCAHKSRPHIHRHRFNRSALSRAECTQQIFGHFQLSLWYQIEHPGAVDVGQYADIGVAAFGTLLIQPQMGHVVFATTQHASLHSTHHDAVDSAPCKPRELANTFGGGASVQQLNHKGFHQKRDPAVAFRPWHGQLLDCAVAVFELGYARFDEGLKLAGIQMPPLALSPAVDVGSLGTVRGISPHLASLENDFNHDALIRQGEVNRLHQPRRFQSKKMFVKGSVFHDGVGVVEKPNSPALRKNSQCNC